MCYTRVRVAEQWNRLHVAINKENGCYSFDKRPRIYGKTDTRTNILEHIIMLLNFDRTTHHSDKLINQFSF